MVVMIAPVEGNSTLFAVTLAEPRSNGLAS